MTLSSSKSGKGHWQTNPENYKNKLHELSIHQYRQVRYVEKNAGKTDPHLLMPAPLTKLSTARLNELNDDEFTQLFAASPIKRIGAEHLRGNIQNLR